MNRILAVDPSFSKSGWALFSINHRKITLEDCGYISKNKKSNNIIIITELAKEVCSILKVIVEKHGVPGHMIIEDQYFSKNAATLKRLTEARVVWEIMYVAGIPEGCIERINPKTWQSQTLALSQKSERKNLKAAAKFAVKHLYGKEVSEDEADAILIGHYFCNQMMIKLRANF